MLYAFTDESYSPRCYLQAAYVVDESKIGAMRECESLIRENLTKIGVPVDTEFHGHAIMNARKGWQKLEGKFHSKIAVIKDLLKEIESIEGYFIIEAIDISMFYTFSYTDESAHQYTSKALLKRINEVALERDAKVKIFSDKISKEERARIRYPDILGIDQHQKIISVTYVDSDKEFGIQIADICSYMARRHLDHMERNLRSARIVSEIKSLLDVRTLTSNKREIWSL
jgi:hypothetical protein